ncbi:DUF2238 domain-containing protein [Niveibacterium microcysteis]|uniref:DUF2238 domain-containing protein n=1 Tax=Niveibacterium microcysteis TaxID=2811415 RepID=A0ABX7M268_9RHOO|nr:DUF2238 domain-containing protein [Niveibacterium microcysteis]QSI75521.1 DUF2238 domain-containing protein [Niveibacterium microcysteis]
MPLIPPKSVSTALTLAVFCATWIHPIWPAEQLLHCSLTIAGVALLWRHVKLHGASDRDYLLIMLFVAVHSVAARWLYSNVPYDRWLTAAFGFSLEHALGWKRNNFDRLVHFLYGFCLTPAVMSFAVQRWATNARVSFVIAVSAIMVTSLWYEWFEWLVAATLSAQDAESYNGQQGDMWDAHKDMLAATLGSLAWSIQIRPSRRSGVVSPPSGAR